VSGDTKFHRYSAEGRISIQLSPTNGKEYNSLYTTTMYGTDNRR